MPSEVSTKSDEDHRFPAAMPPEHGRSSWTLGVMPPMVLYHRYMAEAVWLPTYIGLVMLVLGKVENGTLASALVIVALVGSRMLLELVYRLTFGDARLQLRTQLAAFAFQAVAWGLVWAWHAQRTSAT